MALQRVITKQYVLVKIGKNHPSAHFDGYIYEHRIIAERLLGRPLTKDEVVHHIDGDRFNNSAENLQVMSNSEHSRLHRDLLRPERLERKAKMKADEKALRIQKEQVRLASMIDNEQLTQIYQRFITNGIPMARIARQMGIDPTLLSRKLNGKRPMSRIEYDACSLLLEKQVALTYSRLINGGAPSSVSIDDTEVHQTNDT